MVPIIKAIINCICYVIFYVILNYEGKFFPSLPDDLDTVVNQILKDASLFGYAITSYNTLVNVAKGIKAAYTIIMSKISNNKLHENDIKNQIEILTIENNGGKTR